jgi:hypothetical protein
MLGDRDGWGLYGLLHENIVWQVSFQPPGTMASLTSLFY